MLKHKAGDTCDHGKFMEILQNAKPLDGRPEHAKIKPKVEVEDVSK